MEDEKTVGDVINSFNTDQWLVIELIVNSAIQDTLQKIKDKVSGGQKTDE